MRALVQHNLHSQLVDPERRQYEGGMGDLDEEHTDRHEQHFHHLGSGERIDEQDHWWHPGEEIGVAGRRLAGRNFVGRWMEAVEDKQRGRGYS
jgi:hypothetical protein